MANHKPMMQLLENISKDTKSTSANLMTVAADVTLIKSSFAEINDQLKSLENRLGVVEDRVKALENQHEVREDDVQKVAFELRGDLDELAGRLSKRNNLMVHGIPETEDGEVLFRQLMAIVAENEAFEWEACGNIYDHNKRSLKIYLNNYAAKRRILSNCSKLKGMSQFQRVSIKHDLTKAQIKSQPPRKRHNENNSQPDDVSTRQRDKVDEGRSQEVRRPNHTRKRAKIDAAVDGNELLSRKARVNS